MPQPDVLGPAPAVPAPHTGDRTSVEIAFGPCYPLVPLVLRTVGVFLILTASAMWFLPGGQVAADLILLKLGVSLFFLFCGLALVMIHDADNVPAVCFDPVRRELRVLIPAADGEPYIGLRRSYESLGQVRFHKTRLDLYDFDGRLLLRLRVPDPERRAALRMQLRQSVPICK